MKSRSGPTIAGVVRTTAACLLFVVLASGQTATQDKPLMSDQAFKNVQVLKGIPVDEFMGTMGFFAAALSLNCTECHVSEAVNNLDQYATDTPIKQTARKMILMVKGINQSYFGGKAVVTCYTCHRTSSLPKSAPSLVEQYGTPVDDPNEVELLQTPAPGTPTTDQILDKYIKALGGAQKLAGITSYTAKGAYVGFDTSDQKSPLEVYAKAPDQSTIIVHVKGGDNIRTFDGRSGWNAIVNGLLPLLPLTGGDLDGAKFDASLFFPGGIKRYLTDLRSGFPTTTIDDRQVEVVQGLTASKTPVKLFFDADSGLLVRQVRYRQTAVGPIPTQVDYSDYRAVSGIKEPFHWVMTWTDGRSTADLTQVQLNVPVDASKFVKPNVAGR
jgi:photosynthetic reaction center cytochrome c subunit